MEAPRLSAAARNWQWLALLLVVLPQFERLPAWLSAAVVLACIWRLAPVERRIGSAGGAVRLLLLVGGIAGVWLSHRTLLGPEGGVSFLIVCATLKVLESRTARDCFVSVLLGFFVLATAFLFSQALLLTLYVILSGIVLVAALMALQQRAGTGAGRTLRRATVLLGQALPLMLILFLFFPRLPPLWTLNFSQGSGRTGMSDSMSPGDISSLSESSATAFRVEFQDPPPPSSQLYWRGVVFNYFDGKRWVQGEPVSEPLLQASVHNLPSWVGGVDGGTPAVRYRVILEPTDQPWLFALSVPGSGTARVGLSRDNRLVYREPVYSRLTYDVQSWPTAQVDAAGLPTWLRQQTLQLPEGGNPETRRRARIWRLGSGSDRQFVQDTLDWLRAERFFYTLEPPPLGEDRIDDFLFRTRRGFCEHYAASFVFLMRAAGVPARVVAGYQGGEQSPLGDYWLVRQLDAHAWVEVWLPGSGWVEVDPTAAVAPDRIQRGAAQLATQREYWGSSAGGAMRHGSYRLLKRLRTMTDYVNYRWHRDVLGYDNASQEGLMQRLLGDTSLLRRLAVMGAALAVVAALLMLWALRGERRQQHPLDRLYRRYCARLARRGVRREAGEGPLLFAQRVARERPALAAEAKEFARLFITLRYRENVQDDKPMRLRLQRIARGSWRERLPFD
jgi:transglutaminase-like putative cysteine protease